MKLKAIVNGEVEVIEFQNISVFEYRLGHRKSYLKRLESISRFPKTPYVREMKNGLILRLYTYQQVEDVVALFQEEYPVVYRGRDLILKEKYKQDMLNYEKKVRELEKKWKETDYLQFESNLSHRERKRRNAFDTR